MILRKFCGGILALLAGFILGNMNMYYWPDRSYSSTPVINIVIACLILINAGILISGAPLYKSEIKEKHNVGTPPSQDNKINNDKK